MPTKQNHTQPTREKKIYAPENCTTHLKWSVPSYLKYGF